MQHLAKSARWKARGPLTKWSWVGGDIIRTAPTRADQMDETSMGTLRAVAISELSQPTTATTNGRQARNGLLCHYGLAEVCNQILLATILLDVRPSTST